MEIALSLLFGVVIGWMLRHQRWKSEILHVRQQRLRETVGGLTSLDRQQQAEFATEQANAMLTDTMSPAELERLRDAAAEVDSNRERIQMLSRALAEAEQSVGDARRNDLELRRLRSECEALRHDRASPQTDNARDLDEAIARLESELQARDQRISELQARLDALPEPSPAQTSTQAPTKTPTQKPTLTPLFDAPPDRDNLKKISGIGPKMESLLNQLGVTTFRQLAAFTQDDIQRVSAAMDVFPGRIERDDWVGGAAAQLQMADESNALGVDR